VRAFVVVVGFVVVVFLCGFSDYGGWGFVVILLCVVFSFSCFWGWYVCCLLGGFMDRIFRLWSFGVFFRC